MRRVEITYHTIAEILQTSVGAVKNMEYRGKFNFDNPKSVILFLAANIILQQNQEKTENLPQVHTESI